MPTTPEHGEVRLARKPVILQLGPRRYRVADARFVPVGQDYREAGLALIALAVGLFIALDLRFTGDPLVPIAVTLLGAMGVAIIVKAPLRPLRVTLADFNFSAGLFAVPIKVINGSGKTHHEYAVDAIDEVLFAMRGVPIEDTRPRDVQVDGFSVYLRLFDGELIPIVEACFDHDRTFKVARFVADMSGVGIKQVGKGWRSE